MEFKMNSFSYITFNAVDFKEDDWADISANSHDIIHEIAESYFKKGIDK